MGVSEKLAAAPLRATLEITLPGDAGCSLTEIDSPVMGVRRETKAGNSRGFSPGDSHCHKAISVSNGKGGTVQRYEKSRIEPQCICHIFDNYDCVATIDGVRNGALVIEVTVPDRTILRDLVTKLQQQVESVSMQRIVREGSDATGNIEISTCGITDKQREALRVATRLGYYDTPRRTDLGSLAEELEISKSAVSQRLNAVESKLVKALVRQDCDDPGPDCE